MKLINLLPSLTPSFALCGELSFFLFDPDGNLLDSISERKGVQAESTESAPVFCFTDIQGAEIDTTTFRRQCENPMPGYLVYQGELEGLPVLFSWDTLVSSSGETCSLVMVRDRSHELKEYAWRQSCARRSAAFLSLRKLSHDFNNLISPLMSSFALLQRRSQGSQELLRCADILKKGIERLSEFSATLRSFSPTSTSEHMSVSLRTIRTGVVHDLEHLFFPLPKISWGSMELDREVRVPEELGVLLVAHLVEFSLENGDVEVSVSIRAGDDDSLPTDLLSNQNYCEFSVSHCGVGGARDALPYGAQYPLASIRKAGRLSDSLLKEMASRFGGAFSAPLQPNLARLFLPLVEH